ncbi:MAG: cyclopropane-fatty-acyl-phospholipid synthase family protein, partial [Desulfobacteraceae bacterium]
MNTTANTEQYQNTTKRLSPLDRWSRSILLKKLAQIKYGQIILRDEEKKWTLGDEKGLTVQVFIHHPKFYHKMLFGGSIGAGEAYVDKLWDADNLTRLMRLMSLNMKRLDEMDRGFAWLLRPFELIRHAINRNNRHGARRNILSHYDLGNEMYQSFLDSTMMYSSAIYPRKDSSLEEASLNKLKTICRKLTLKPTDRVIEIGSGWGGFAIYAAKNYGCHVTTTTISEAQYSEAKKRIIQAGLEDKITLLKKDYRDLTGQYDKLVSIEMIEAVGHKYMPDFFYKCGELLKED